MLPAVKVRDAIKAVQSAGWVLLTTRGSHRELKHPAHPGKVRLPATLMPEVTSHAIRSRD